MDNQNKKLLTIIYNNPFLCVLAGAAAGLFGYGMDAAASNTLVLSPTSWGLAGALFGAAVGLSPAIIRLATGKKAN